MNKNKNCDMTPFDMSKKPIKQYFFLLPLIWGGSFFLTRSFGLKIKKEKLENIKPPFLVVATHQGPADYYIGPLALFPHRAMYVSDMEGFAAFGKWLYRGLGCIGKRRYVSDIAVVKNMKYALSIGQSVVVYPESRHSNVGTTAYIPKNLGKLAKVMKVPVVVLQGKGSYLANPFWDEEHTRKVPIEATLKGLFTKEEVQQISELEIQRKIEEALQYDEYKYQQEKEIKILNPKRAEGIHKPLYQCIRCEAKYHMKSYEERLECEKCGATFSLTEDGWLMDLQNKEKIHIPNWYEWERQKVFKTLEGEKLHRTYEVYVEALPNEKGFVPLGEGKLYLDENAFRLCVGDKDLLFSHCNRESVQTEYNYKGKGMCIVLSNTDCCYYIYSKEVDFSPTELQFIGEYLYGIKS